MTNVSYEATIKDIDASLKASELGYIDLYLLHSAIGGPDKRRECWRACVDAKKAGKVKSIGVSNYGIAHLQEMVDQGVELPVLNQVIFFAAPLLCGLIALSPGGPAPVHDTY